MGNTEKSPRKVSDLLKKAKNKENIQEEKTNVDSQVKQNRVETRVVAYNSKSPLSTYILIFQ